MWREITIINFYTPLVSYNILSKSKITLYRKIPTVCEELEIGLKKKRRFIPNIVISFVQVITVLRWSVMEIFTIRGIQNRPSNKRTV